VSVFHYSIQCLSCIQTTVQTIERFVSFRDIRYAPSVRFSGCN